ncbi:MAG: N-acetylmuramoyl-L-alanine amidase [Treponemataceae bacterium]|jgi:N-acetylmuramoyl-L-alanine amidase|nr:N-acetylmuramoyl-L-alanine amidase [Treponemataceae bacterium]
MKNKLFVFLLSIFLIFSNSFVFGADENILNNENLVKNGYISLVEASENLGASLFWDPITSSGILEKNGNSLSFALNQEIVVFNFRDFSITEPPILQNDKIYISQKLVESAQNLFLTPVNDSSFKIGAILIDAGHGGKDPGTVGSVTKDGKKIQLNEKDIVLTVAQGLNNALKSKYPDKKILMTRSTDVYLTLEQRVEIANSVELAENEAIVFVSIHANSAFDKKAKGFETWYLSPGYRRSILKENEVDADILPILNSMLEEEFTTESILIAKFIDDGLKKQVGDLTKSRGLKEEEWFVVRNANMPSVLVEVGFVSNPEEALLLSDQNYLRKLALGIYNGVSSFVTHFEQSRGFTISQ